MAMYYYASKLSAVACGLRCKQQQRRRRKGSSPATMAGTTDGGDEDDEEVVVVAYRKHNGKGGGEGDDELNLDEILHKKWNNQSLATTSLTNIRLVGQQPQGPTGALGMAATSTIIEYHGNYKELASNQDNLSAAVLVQDSGQASCPVLGPNGVMYLEGRVVSGPLDSLVKLLLPVSTSTLPPRLLAEELDEEYIFAFLLSSRIFIQPHELLGQLIADIVLGGVVLPAANQANIVTINNNTSKLSSGRDNYADQNAISSGDSLPSGLANHQRNNEDGVSVGEAVSNNNSNNSSHNGAEPSLPALECLVKFLGVWTTKFPYDFRDERIMSHVKHIVAQCANNELNDIVSELLCALLTRLTDLEQHEEDLRASLTPTNTEMVQTKWVSSSHLAQLLSRIERKLAKHVGGEEFVQCNGSVLQKAPQGQATNSVSGILSASVPVGVQGPKKTCNLETYLDWSLKLKMLVANDILQTLDLMDRVKMVELWSGAAQYCLLVGNYNSATAILEALDSPAISRLTETWSNLLPMSQQLSCMYRHAEGHGDLWSKQTTTTIKGLAQRNSLLVDQQTKKPSTPRSKAKRSSEWVVIPVFKDIVRLALVTRDECATKIGNDHVNMLAFDRMAAIVAAFTKHMKNVASPQPTVDGEFELIFRQMNNCSLTSEADLMAASCALEQPTDVTSTNQNLINKVQDFS